MKHTRININPDLIVQEAARRRLLNFSRYMQPDMAVKPYHEVYYTLLDMFAHGKIRKMIVQMPPQHGKSEGSSRKLPAFMLGLNPDLKICIGSYSTTNARDFNRDVQRLIDSKEYQELFPNTYLNRSNVVTMANNYLRNSDVIEMVGHRGSLRVVGRGGALTGKSVDISILDDVYKDYQEGSSPVTRSAAWNWYTSVVKTRLHNDSQELIVFTRWHEDDIIGMIEKSNEKVVEVTSWKDLEQLDKKTWVKINFEGIKTSKATEFDNREEGEVLWPERHSKEELESRRELDDVKFQCLYQGNPASAESRLYQHPFKTWVTKEDYGTYIRSGNYTDVADEGSDYMCSICYDIYKGENEFYNEKTKKFEPLIFALVTDVIFTDADTEVTGVTIPAMLNRNGTQKAWIESNNGGAGFEKVVRKKVKAITTPFYQGGNKESRIITNAGMVNSSIVMPFGWEERFPAFHDHLSRFLRDFRANKHDDAEDALTGVYEKEIQDGNINPYWGNHRGIRYRN